MGYEKAVDVCLECGEVLYVGDEVREVDAYYFCGRECAEKYLLDQYNIRTVLLDSWHKHTD